MAFGVRAAFAEALARLPEADQIRCRATAQRFEAAWGQLAAVGQVPDVYRLKPLARKTGEWKLLEIRALGDRRRLVFAEIDGHGCWWVYAFRKSRNSNADEVQRAKREADKLWREMASTP